MAIDAKYIMNIQGREHVTYDGLLDEATRRGLIQMEVELLQAPSEANKHTAIARATATFSVEGSCRIFTEIGDANAGNVNRMIGPHAIRMAATRAKARALRDALNIKGAAFEELGGPDMAEAQPAAAPAPAPAAPAEPASDEQKAGIGQLCDKLGWDKDKCQRWLVKRFSKTSRKQLTATEAAAALDELRERVSKLPAA